MGVRVMSESMESVDRPAEAALTEDYGFEQDCPECGAHALQCIGDISARCVGCGELCAPCIGCNTGFLQHRGRRDGENISACDTCTYFVATPGGDS